MSQAQFHVHHVNKPFFNDIEYFESALNCNQSPAHSGLCTPSYVHTVFVFSGLLEDLKTVVLFSICKRSSLSTSVFCFCWFFCSMLIHPVSLTFELLQWEVLPTFIPPFLLSFFFLNYRENEKL